MSAIAYEQRLKWPFLLRALDAQLVHAYCDFNTVKRMAAARELRWRVCGGYARSDLMAMLVREQHLMAKSVVRRAVCVLALIGALRASLRLPPPVDAWALLCAAADRFRAALGTGKPDLIRQRNLAVCRIMDEHDFGCRVTFDFVTGQVWRGGADVFDEYAD